MAKKDKIRYEDLIITSDMDDAEIEDVIRWRIQWRQRKWRQLAGNLPSFIIVNAIIWSVYHGGFPWPIFVTFFWGMGIVKDAWELFQASNGMQSRRDEFVQREVEREKSRLGLYSEKPKRDYVEKAKNRPIRIGSEGEIVPLEELLRDEDEQDEPRYQRNER